MRTVCHCQTKLVWDLEVKGFAKPVPTMSQLSLPALMCYAVALHRPWGGPELTLHVLTASSGVRKSAWRLTSISSGDPWKGHLSRGSLWSSRIVTQEGQSLPVLLSFWGVNELRPKLHWISHGLFLSIFHQPSFVPFWFSITVCKAWWLQLLWEALQKIILHAHLFHLGMSQGLAKWQMLMHAHVQPQRGWGASVSNLWLSPVPVLMQPRRCQGGHGHSVGRKITLPASQVTHRSTNPRSDTAHSSVSILLQSCVRTGRLGTRYLCSGFTRWHYSMYIYEGTDTIKIPYKELCCRSKMALASTALISKLSRSLYCSLTFSLSHCVIFRKKSSTKYNLTFSCTSRVTFQQ